MSREMYLLQSFMLLLSISIICKSQPCKQPLFCNCQTLLRPVCCADGITYNNQCSADCKCQFNCQEGACPTTTACTPPLFCNCQTLLSPVCCADGITYNNQCSADCKCQFNCQEGTCKPTTTTSDPTEMPTIIPTTNPTEPSKHPTTHPTTSDPIQTTRTDIEQCFIGSKCDKSDDCCEDSVDGPSIGIKCMKKKKKKSRSSDSRKRKTKNFCCIKKGFSGCILDKDCCPNKRGEKGICSSENICVTKSKHSDDSSNYNALINEEEIDDTSNMESRTLDKFSSHGTWIIFGVLIGFIIMLCVLCYVCVRGVALNKYSNVRDPINDDKDVCEQMEEGCSNGQGNVIDYGVVCTQEHNQ